MVEEADALLEVRNLSILDGKPINFSVHRQETLVVQGPSGCGKSLLLRALCDLDPHQGSVSLCGVECADMPPEQWRTQVAYLPAESHWWADEVGAHFRGDWQGGLSAMGFGPEVAAWQINRLSTGERQRLAIIRALVNQPQVWLLDEPTANLDPENTRRVETLVLEYLRGRQAAAVWVSHDMEQARRLGTRAIRYEAGQWRESEL